MKKWWGAASKRQIVTLLQNKNTMTDKLDGYDAYLHFSLPLSFPVPLSFYNLSAVCRPFAAALLSWIAVAHFAARKASSNF
mgnify:CR=1 FL=1